MLKVFAAALLALTLGSPAIAGESTVGNRDEAVAMVKRVQHKFEADGAQPTFRAVSDAKVAEFHDRDLYPFVYDLEGVNVAHGARPALIGKSLISMKDQDGKYLIQEMIVIAKSTGSGWIDYKWPNPITNRIEDKTSYVERMGDYLVGVGIYHPGQ
jgi:cytochrome c